MEQIRLALETDPLSILLHFGMALCMVHAKQYRETIECARRALEIDPNAHVIWLILGAGQLYSGLPEEAITSLKRVVELVPWSHIGVGALAAAYYKSGDHERTQEWGLAIKDLHGGTFGAAFYYAAVGDVDAMFRALDEAHRKRDVNLLHIHSSPFFDPYTADPRFRTLLAKMNLG